MQEKVNWQPSASIQNTVLKNTIIAKIRKYFESEGVLEVDTPVLSTSTVTDLHLDALETIHTNPLSVERTHLFLQTSPEYYMKRLLSAGYPSIYQIARCFRDDEVGRYHSPEFLMLEWYRLDFSMQELIEDVINILRVTLNINDFQQITYAALFEKLLDIDVIGVSFKELQNVCSKYGFEHIVSELDGIERNSADFDLMLQLLFSEVIEPLVGIECPIVVTHFPASQASLATLSKDNPKFAQRFEVYYRGIELANGFEELADENELRQRFDSDNRLRKVASKKQKPIDEKFLQAIEAGLPACSGVALGLDRLLMIAAKSEHIQEVQSFAFDTW
jgi:lysyl-tRNA synthetase class 2